MKLRELRKRQFKTLADVATAAEVSVALISLIERGLRYPAPKTLKRLAEKGYQIDVNTFDLLFEKAKDDGKQ